MAIVNPQWLMEIMREIMELTPGKSMPGLDNHLVVQLEKSGVAGIELLQFCWRQHVSSAVDFRHLCLICKTYSLIFPDQSDKNYVIPCKLPEKLSDNKIVKRMTKSATEFYFDFRNFLPDEIYHRLICLMISNVDNVHHCNNQYSHLKCYFDGVLGTKWIIEKEEAKQRLRVMVM